jgi:RimJ/RimL family protein N-acetyltransferase
MEERDLPMFVEWMGDHEVTRWLAQTVDAPTLEEEYEWYERRHRFKAEFGIVIGDKGKWSQGLGTETTRLVVGYALGELKLNRVELTTAEENERAIRCYEKIGFVREGIKRQDRILDGRFSNTLMMSILREEWKPAKRGRK